LIYIIIAFLSFLITIISTPYLINYLTLKNIVDNPDGGVRRVHDVPIPRMGGIIIFIVVLVITFSFYHDIQSKLFFLLGALVVFGLGLWDDISVVKWKTKFIVQSIAAIFLIISLTLNGYTIIKFVTITIPSGLNYAILFLLIMGILNSFNLMDGLDGLVTGFSLIIASMCLLLSISSEYTFLPFLSSAIIGSTLGFLKFNANPARIFLGDSGSLTLGYFISSLVIVISSRIHSNDVNSGLIFPRTIDLAFVIIALALPLADTVRVMFVRFIEKRHLFLPDNNHLHHILYKKNIRHKSVVLIIHLFSISFVLLAIYYAEFSKLYALILFTITLILFFFIRPIIELIIKHNYLLKYVSFYKKAPEFAITFYKKILLPLVLLLLMLLMIFLVITEIQKHQYSYIYFLLFLFPTLFYSRFIFLKKHYYTELIVLVNLILFFIITGLNGFFYKQYPVPILNQININQIFIIVLSAMVIFFVLFKERITNKIQQFLTGSDLTIAVLILFVYIAVHLLNIPESYRISDTLLRSFLVFIFYKIIITVKPQFHSPLYYSSYAVAALAVFISLL